MSIAKYSFSHQEMSTNEDMSAEQITTTKSIRKSIAAKVSPILFAKVSVSPIVSSESNKVSISAITFASIVNKPVACICIWRPELRRYLLLESKLTVSSHIVLDF